MRSGETLEHLLYSSFTDLDAAGLLLSHALTSFSFLLLCSSFLPFLSMLSQRHASIITWLFGQQNVSVGIGSVRYGGSLQCLLTEATPVAPLLPKPGLSNPIHHMLQDRIIAPTLTASPSRHQGQGYPNPLSSDWANRPDHHWKKKLFRYC